MKKQVTIVGIRIVFEVFLIRKSIFHSQNVFLPLNRLCFSFNCEMSWSCSESIVLLPHTHKFSI